MTSPRGTIDRRRYHRSFDLYTTPSSVFVVFPPTALTAGHKKKNASSSTTARQQIQSPPSGQTNCTSVILLLLLRRKHRRRLVLPTVRISLGRFGLSGAPVRYDFQTGRPPNGFMTFTAFSSPPPAIHHSSAVFVRSFVRFARVCRRNQKYSYSIGNYDDDNCTNCYFIRLDVLRRDIILRTTTCIIISRKNT